MNMNPNICPDCGCNTSRPVCPNCGLDMAQHRLNIRRMEEEEERRQQREAELAEMDRDYQVAITALCNGHYRMALAGFMALGDYKDAANRAQEAKKALYNAAVAVFCDSEMLAGLYDEQGNKRAGDHDEFLRKMILDGNVPEMDQVVNAFNGIEDYADSRKYLRACQDAAQEGLRVLHELQAELAEEQRIEEERLAEEERIRKAKQAELDRQAFLKNTYQHGLSMMASEKYAEAIQDFEQVGDYEDALAKLKEAKALKTQQDEYNRIMAEQERKARAIRMEENRKKQEKEAKKKKTIAIFKWIGFLAIVAAVIFLCKQFNIDIKIPRKYSPNNVNMTMVEKTVQGIDGYSGQLKMHFVMEAENNGKKDITGFEGTMKMYNADGDCLFSDTVTYNGNLSAGGTLRYDLNLKLNATDATRELYNTDLEGLKITYKITKISYGAIKTKKFPRSKEKILHEADKDYATSKDPSSPTKDPAQADFDVMVDAYAAADPFSATYVQDLNVALERQVDLFNRIKESDTLKAAMYELAENYEKAGNYEKAYYLFADLDTMEYKDSNDRASECYMQASSVTYHSSMPGRSGITFEYGCRVYYVAEDYDAHGKLQYGDTIIKVDGRSIDTTSDREFNEKLAGKKAGDTVELTVQRGPETVIVTIKLGYRYFNFS